MHAVKISILLTFNLKLKTRVYPCHPRYLRLSLPVLPALPVEIFLVLLVPLVANPYITL